MDCSAFLLTRKKTVFLFVNCNATNRKQRIAERAKNTCQEITIQTNVLKSVFQSTVTPIFSCFVCFDETEENFTDEQRSACFVKIQKRCYAATVHKVIYRREKTSRCTIHTVLDTESIKMKMHEIISDDDITETIDLSQLALVHPKEKSLYLRINVFRSDDGSLSEISLHSDVDLNHFCDQYFPKLGSALTTLPDFDRIKRTKLYPLGKDRLDDFKCPGQLPGWALF